MHAVVRSYSGPGAKELFELIASRKDDVEALISGVTGFVSYTVIETDDGGMTVTVCQDQAGCDESVKRAREWIKTNSAETGLGAPSVSQGSVSIHRT